MRVFTAGRGSRPPASSTTHPPTFCSAAPPCRALPPLATQPAGGRPTSPWVSYRFSAGTVIRSKTRVKIPFRFYSDLKCFFISLFSLILIKRTSSILIKGPFIRDFKELYLCSTSQKNNGRLPADCQSRCLIAVDTCTWVFTQRRLLPGDLSAPEGSELEQERTRQQLQDPALMPLPDTRSDGPLDWAHLVDAAKAFEGLYCSDLCFPLHSFLEVKVDCWWISLTAVLVFTRRGQCYTTSSSVSHAL